MIYLKKDQILAYIYEVKHYVNKVAWFQIFWYEFMYKWTEDK